MEEDVNDSPSSAPAYACPNCGAAVETPPADASSPWVTCNNCQNEFAVAPTADETDASADQTDAESDEQASLDDAESELDSLRIRNLSVGRRAAIRARSYALIAMLACIVLVGQLAQLTYRYIRSGYWSIRPVGYAVLGVALIWGAFFFLRRALELHREVKRSALQEPKAPPDFSTLSDGSQYVENLEKLK